MITTDLMQHSNAKWLILGVRGKNVVQSKIFALILYMSHMHVDKQWKTYGCQK